jgi:uncharacterized protein YbbC (DUF1343 family)
MNIMFAFSRKITHLYLVAALFFSSCNTAPSQPAVCTGCERTELYLQKLNGKSVGLVANHTTVIGTEHLADFLIRQGIGLTRIFAPEHGFRGDADAGADIRNDVDAATGVPVVSLYGDKYKPTAADLQGIDIMIYDIQDVGVRFYTYISTLHYLMEACAENNIPLLILDRPDPLGYYVDGPILQNEFRSFVGLHPIPIVYGMTPGELALMINGEGWLKDGEKCNLQVIPCSGYDHNSRYQLPVNPSPNLNCMQAIYLYPSICLFEGTIMSLGRGTSSPFRVIGHPDYPDKDFSFIPKAGKSNQNPLLKDQTCYGIDLQNILLDSLKQINSIKLKWLIDVSRKMNRGKDFFIPYIDRLAGTEKFREQILQDLTERQIRQSWQRGLDDFCKKRTAYLLYPDFTR